MALRATLIERPPAFGLLRSRLGRGVGGGRGSRGWPLVAPGRRLIEITMIIGLPGPLLPGKLRARARVAWTSFALAFMGRPVSMSTSWRRPVSMSTS